MKYYKRIGLFLLLQPLIFTACSSNFAQITGFSDNEKVCYRLPDWKTIQSEITGLPDLAFWKIVYFSTQGQKEIRIPSDEENFSVNFPKNETSGILAYPVTVHKEQDKGTFLARITFPAGAIYPYNKSNITWNQGFPAGLLRELYWDSLYSSEAGEYLSTFNWQLLIEKLSQNESKAVEQILNQWNEDSGGEEYQAFYNPWLLNRQAILSAISGGKFSVSKLNFPQSASLTQNNQLFDQCPGLQNFVSLYIPENYIFGKVNFLTIIKKSENSSCFLFNDKIAEISLTSGGSFFLNLCSIPHFKED